MKTKKISRFVSLVLCLVLIISAFAGCGKENSGSGSANQGSSGTISVSDTSLNLTLKNPENELFYGNTVNFSWEGLENDKTVDLKLEKKNGDTYTAVLEKTGITGSSFTSDDKLENETVYKLTLSSTLKNGKKGSLTKEFTAVNFIKNTTINAGMDFTFKGSISEKVLNNYLSRAITYTNANFDDAIRAILNTGTKYVCRSVAEWYPSRWFEDSWFPAYEELIELAHKYDPEIIFEGCIFETTGKDIDTIKIPDWVFAAFGKNPENRTFNHTKMLFPDNFGKDMWAEGYSLPDITREETQMFIYYRACKLIDIGIEALHLGQTKQTGRNDKNNECWSKVINLIRKYAKENARRNYVIINSHHADHAFTGTNGVMLVDFIMSPLRPKATRKMGDPISPQKCVIDMEADAPYKKGYKGTSPSGWTTNHYPYLVEFDNFTPDAQNSVWEMDEISWIVSQPDDYRRSFLTEVRKMVSDLNENGHVALIGKRSTASAQNGVELYMMNNSKFCEGGFSDEDAIIAAFKAYK